MYTSIANRDLYPWVKAIDAHELKGGWYALPLPVVVFGNACGLEAVFDGGECIVFIPDPVIGVVDGEFKGVAYKFWASIDSLKPCYFALFPIAISQAGQDCCSFAALQDALIILFGWYGTKETD